MLLLVLAFSTSGLVHNPMDDHAASAASFLHEIVSASQDASGEPCRTEDSREADGATCCIASLCSFCVPLISSSTIVAPSDNEVIEMQPNAVHLSRAPSAQFRPPKLSANI